MRQKHPPHSASACTVSPVLSRSPSSPTMLLGMKIRQHNEKMLRRMVRSSTRAVEASARLLQRTNQLLKRFETQSHFKINRPDIRIDGLSK